MDVVSYPKFITNLKWGVEQLRFDIFTPDWKEHDWVFPPVVGENGYVGAATNSIYADPFWAFNPALMNKEDVIAYPLENLVRTSTFSAQYYPHAFWWFGKLANGSYIAPGDYK